MAIVKVALRQKETLAVLRVRDKAILLQTMLWPDEVRKADFASLDADVELRHQEMKMAASLIESMPADFEPEQFTDDYQAAVRDLIDAKLERGESATLATEEKPADTGKGGEVIDLLTALQGSVARARSGPAKDADAEPAAEDKPTRKEPAKKAAGKKAAARKVPAKKAPAKKAASTKAPAKKAAAKSA